MLRSYDANRYTPLLIRRAMIRRSESRFNFRASNYDIFLELFENLFRRYAGWRILPIFACGFLPEEAERQAETNVSV